MTTGSIILAWRIPWKEEPGRLLSMGLQESDRTDGTHTHPRTHARQHGHTFSSPLFPQDKIVTLLEMHVVLHHGSQCTCPGLSPAPEPLSCQRYAHCPLFLLLAFLPKPFYLPCPLCSLLWGSSKF